MDNAIVVDDSDVKLVTATATPVATPYQSTPSAERILQQSSAESAPINAWNVRGIDVSYLNAVRRILLSDVPTLVFRTSPHAKNLATVTVNTTRQNNEYLLQRLSCIPIEHVINVSRFFENPPHLGNMLADITFAKQAIDLVRQIIAHTFLMTLTSINPADSGEIQYATTEHFRIICKLAIPVDIGERLRALPEVLRRQAPSNILQFLDTLLHDLFKLPAAGAGAGANPDLVLAVFGVANPFPPVKLGAAQQPYYTELARLRPGDTLELTCKLAVGYAREDSAFNLTATCAYACKVDEQKADAVLAELNLQDESSKRDWNILERKRFIKADEFAFRVQAVSGVPGAANALFQEALMIMLQKLAEFKTALAISPPTLTASTIANCYDFVIKGEGYTLGKVLESTLYRKYFVDTPKLTFCGFRKPHPHIDECILRIALLDAEKAQEKAIEFVKEAADDASTVFTQMFSELLIKSA